MVIFGVRNRTDCGWEDSLDSVGVEGTSRVIYFM